MTSVIERTGTRQFIDWNQLPLPAAAEWLVSALAEADELDMSSSVLVVPSSRAGRRLMELILQVADQRQLILTPPLITTIGNFPEQLYRPGRKLASELVQKLAWVSALRDTPEKEFRVFTSFVPEADDSLGWLTLAQMLGVWHRELAGDALSFEDVLQSIPSSGNVAERRRWQLLVDVQRRYLDALHQQELWDRQTARLVAIKNHECRTDKRIFLIGMVDLNLAFRQMLAQVASQVSAIVFADHALSDKFDSLGCLIIDQWKNVELEISDDQIRVADQPADQAKLLTDYLIELDGRYSIDQITVGVPDWNLTSQIKRTLLDFEIDSHDSGLRQVSQTRPYLALELIANWIGDQRFENFAQLLRHPDIFTWASNQVGSNHWLTELDVYQNDRLPFYLPVDPDKAYFEGKDRHGHKKFSNLQRIHQCFFQLISPLVGGKRPLAEWSRPWQEILIALYGDTGLDRNSACDGRLIQACQALMQNLVELEESGDLWPASVSGIDAIEWVFSLVDDARLYDPHPPDSLSLVGWLDLPLDDAPVSIITNVNDGFIPSSESSNLFLPNSRRTELGLVDNDRRYARDAYAMNLILHSRRELLLICGRRDGDAQPILPSRLLLTGPADLVARRARRLFGEGEIAFDYSLEAESKRPKHQQLEIPRPFNDEPPINSMRVTDFKSYITCPYRFYLSRVLNLERVHDRRDELDSAQFGSLVHDVVEKFGRSEVKFSDDEQEINDYLNETLRKISLARYGRRPMPAVQIQLEQARLRLSAFSRWQAEHRRQGWEIVEVEREKTRYQFDLDGEPFEIRGQIDRIDVHHSNKKLGIYDYKTSDTPKGPRRYHQIKGGNWIDLQLPLYRWLAKSIPGLPEDYEVQLGLILITKDTSRIRLELADWTSAELNSADERAFQIMRDVRARKFWPPAERNMPPFLDDLSAICQTTVFERWTPEQKSTRRGSGSV